MGKIRRLILPKAQASMHDTLVAKAHGGTQRPACGTVAYNFTYKKPMNNSSSALGFSVIKHAVVAARLGALLSS